MSSRRRKPAGSVIGGFPRGHTLIELVMAMASASVLMAGLGASVLIASRTLRPESSAEHARTDAAFTQHDLLADLRLATGFTERTAIATTFTVPDRDQDGKPETLRYAWSGTRGAPLTLSYNGAAPFTVAKDVQIFSLSYVTRNVAGVTLPAEQTGSQILLVVNDSRNPTANELARKTLIESWNFVVAMKGLNDGLESLLTAASQSQAVYVSATLSDISPTFGDAFAARSVGIVNEHVTLLDDLGFASSSTKADSVTQVNIVNNSHYITAGQPTGNVSIGFPDELRSLDGTLATNLNTLASASSKPALATIDPGKVLYDGRTAAGRRVTIPWASEKTNPASWNATSQMLMLRAIEWATGLGDESPVIKNFGYVTVFTNTNGTSNTQYSTLAPLADKAKLLSISAYIGGANDQVRFAVYKDNNGQPDQLLVQSAVGNSASDMAWVTLPVPATDLNPGNYWLAISFKNSNQRFRYTTVGAGERNKSNNAVTNGFVTPWGTSSSSSNGARSIYATYEVLQ